MTTTAPIYNGKPLRTRKDKEGKGAYVYFFNKDGKRRAKPTWMMFYGNQKTAQDIVDHLTKLNPGQKFEAAY